MATTVYCDTARCDPLSAPLHEGIHFLAELADNTGYSAVSTAHSALSTVITRKCTFFIGKLLKHSKPRNPFETNLVVKAYPTDSKLCEVEHLKAYLKATATIRQDDTALFISYQKPHKAVSKDTISRWIKRTLTSAGIDTNIYGAHGSRAASTSAAARQGLPLAVIFQSAGWYSNSTFEKFYNLELENQPNFGEKLLDKFQEA